MDRRAGVAPAVAKHVTITRHQHGVAGRIGNAHQRGRTHRLTVLIVANARLNTAGGAVGIGVYGVAGDVTEQGVKGGAPDLAAVGHVEIRLVGLHVSKTAIPAGLFNTA